MPDTDSHGRPIIVAARWFGKLPAHPRKLKPGEQPPVQPSTAETSPEDEDTSTSGRDF